MLNRFVTYMYTLGSTLFLTYYSTGKFSVQIPLFTTGPRNISVIIIQSVPIIINAQM